ncbi:MAG: S-adenosylmethionine:tRNA ribosyltransferase-isomerase [Patescibacteria group bacterium]|nr:MAG: S-adenosylmethionine:tRNA ribosyltransferase-isomerase [Patescibacteria group bacterium]
MDKKLYDYHLPDNLLAKIPVSPRDSAKLFVYDTKTDEIIFDRFLNLDKYLPNNSFLVLNNSQVVPSRVTMFKKTGGKVVVLFFVNELINSQNYIVRGLVDRKINLGEKLFFDKENFIEVKNQEKNIFTFKFDYSKEKLFSLLYKYGNMPIPLYLKDSPLKKDKLLKKYQTIFADKLGDKKLGSIAAPTASLHFTNRVFKKIEKKGIERLFLKLYVGIGTFAPITEENLRTKKLHQEYYEIDKNTYEKIIDFKKQGKKLVAVGTTVVRTLESIARQQNFLSPWGPYPKSEKNLLPPLIEKTDLFIFPPYAFKMVDILITNFHLPGSSLMMLVEAFLQYKKAKKHLIDLYNIAIKNDFRFYSFGDSMVIK